MSTTTESDLSKATDASGLSSTDGFDQFSRRSRSGRRRTGSGAGLDQYDSILWRLQPLLEASQGGATILGVTGATEGTGSTTVAANLANRIVDHVDGPVLLVDANFFRPRAARLLGLKKNPGLAEVIADDTPLGDAIQSTSIVGLDFLAAGKAGILEHLGIHPDSVAGVINELREAYSAIVIDFSEANDLGPSLLLAKHCDGTLLVARSERTRIDAAQRAVKRLELDGVNVVGAVLNRHRNYVPRWLRRWL